MNKIALIIQREYITRVKNKTFLLITLLAPILYGLIIMIPVFTAKYSNSKKTVVVVDESGKFHNFKSENNNLVFVNQNQSLPEAEKNYKTGENDFYILHIPRDFDIYNPKG